MLEIVEYKNLRVRVRDAATLMEALFVLKEVRKQCGELNDYEEECIKSCLGTLENIVGQPSWDLGQMLCTELAEFFVEKLRAS